MLQFDTESTICAIATGEAPGVRGGVRITGPDTIFILRKVCEFPADCRFPSRWKTEIDDEFLGKLSVDLFCWPTSRSYTGQPSAEIHMLGAPVLLQRVQQNLLQAGAKLAQPGEFTLRAFLAGRLDLTQCEGVLGVIHATTQRSLDVALTQLAGGLATPLQETRRELIYLLADIEAGLDFVDEDIRFITKEEVLRRLGIARAQIDKLLQQMDSRSGPRSAMQVAIAGLPNAGKSSLLNAIAGDSIAIVSQIPGTTRDFLRYRVERDDVAFDLLDTAGIETWSDDSPRGKAQLFTWEQIELADLILYCHPCTEEFRNRGPGVSPGITAAFNNESPKPTWILQTKSDLLDPYQTQYQPDAPARDSEESPPETSLPTYPISIHHSSTIESLVQRIVEWVRQTQASRGDAIPMTVERCRGSMGNALIAVDAAIEATTSERGDEIVAGELRIALDEIGLVTGTIYTEDILDALFSRFCIGK